RLCGPVPQPSSTSFVMCDVSHPDLHSFPTRRSSDLLKRKDGEKFFGHFSLTAHHDDEEQLTGLSLVIRNDTDRKLVEDQQKSNRSEEHTSELQSQSNLVCRLLLEKKKEKYYNTLLER